MEQLMQIKEQLIAQVQGQMGDLRKVDAKELGEVIDMIKDLAEACYYCSVTEAMDDAKDNEKRQTYYYMEKYLPYYPYSRENDYRDGRMYYDGNSSSSNSSNNSGGSQMNGSRNYYEESYPMWHDDREGRAGQKRKMYMESKEKNHDQPKKIQELDDYMKELTSDITEMIAGASPEEKSLLQRKMNTLVTKLQNV